MSPRSHPTEPTRGARLVAALGLTAAVCLPARGGAQTVFQAAGPTAASIQARVDAFRAALGTPGTEQRSINWDGVPDAQSAPNLLPADYFNVENGNPNTPVRGVVFATPGTGLQVSGNPANGAPAEFSNINPTYPTLFAPYSGSKLFSALGSNVVDVNFFVPGTPTPALTRGFGSVFSDVDLPNTTSIEFFGANGASLGTFFAPAVGAAAGLNETFAFLGVLYDAPVISRVRLTSGNAALGPTTNESATVDLVVMDDFIYGQPIALAAVPEPATAALVAAGLLGAAGVTRRRRAG